MQAINHCGMTAEAQNAGYTKEDFQEAVMERAGQLVTKAITGEDPGSPHGLAGVELVATAVANAIVEEGARQVAQDLGVNLGELKKLAQSTHISIC